MNKPDPPLDAPETQLSSALQIPIVRGAHHTARGKTSNQKNNFKNLRHVLRFEPPQYVWEFVHLGAVFESHRRADHVVRHSPVPRRDSALEIILQKREEPLRLLFDKMHPQFLIRVPISEPQTSQMLLLQSRRFCLMFTKSVPCPRLFILWYSFEVRWRALTLVRWAVGQMSSNDTLGSTSSRIKWMSHNKNGYSCEILNWQPDHFKSN